MRTELNNNDSVKRKDEGVPTPSSSFGDVERPHILPDRCEQKIKDQPQPSELIKQAHNLPLSMVGKTEKVCPNCKKNKSITEFAKSKSKPDGHASWCKECDSKRNTKKYEMKKKQAKAMKKKNNSWKVSVVGTLNKDSVEKFCQIFGEIYRGVSDE